MPSGSSDPEVVPHVDLVRELSVRLRETQTLLTVSQALSTTLDLTEALRRVARETARAIGADMVGAFLADPDESCLRPTAGYHVPKPLLDRLREFPIPLKSHLFFEEGWRSARPVSSTHAGADPRIDRETLDRFRPRSLAFVPMVVKGAPIGGLLAVWWGETHELSGEELRLVDGIGRQAGLAVENARLYGEAERRRQEAEIFAELSQALNASLDLDTVLERVVEGARAACGSDMAHIALRDPDSGVMVFRYWAGTRYRGHQPYAVEPGKGLGGQVLLTGQPFRTDNYARDPRISKDYLATIQGEEIVASMAVPIKFGDRVEGLLFVDNRSPRPFTDWDETILRRLAEQAAIAAQNARLFAQTEQRRRAAETLADLGRLVSQSLDPAEVGQRIAESVRALLGVQASTLYRLEPESEDLVALAIAEEGRPTVARGMVLPRGTGVSGLAVHERRPVVTTDALIDPRFSLTAETRSRVERASYRAVLSVPLVVKNQVIGALAVADRAGRVFSEDETRLAQTFADQAALALENARLFGETGRRLKETETLLAVGQILSLNQPVQEAMRQVARAVARAFGADMVGAYFLDARKENLVPVAGYRVPKELIRQFLTSPFPLARFELLRQAFATGRPVWTADYVHDPGVDSGFLTAAQPRAVLFAPTLVRGDIVGGLFLVWWTPGRRFTAGEVRLIEGVAAQVGLALENADLVRQTQEKLAETETLLSLTRVLSSTLDLQSLLRHFLRQVARTTRADSVGVWLANPATGDLEPLSGYRVPPRILAEIREYRIRPAENAFYAEGTASRRALVSTNVPEDPRIPDSFKAIVPHRTQLFAPIVAKDSVIGAFIAVWWQEARAFSDRELALIEAMGSQAGVAVANAELFLENQRRLEELSVLHELSRAVTGQLDIARLVQAIHQQVGRVLDAGNMVLLFFDEARGEFEVGLRMVDNVPDGNPIRRYPLGVGLMSRVVERRQPIRTSDYAAACRAEGVTPVPTSLRLPHWLGVPMIAGDQPLGVLALRNAVRPFTEADERLLLNIAGLAALAIRSARLYEERTRAYAELAATQNQLILSEKLRALGEMAAGVAHDFNNILAAVMGRAQLLLSQTEDPAQRRQLEIIETAAMDGARTVRRIQEFTRMRRARPFQSVNLNQLVDEVLEVTRSRWMDAAQAQGVAYDLRVEAAPVSPVAGDPSELREVLTNLLFNALDAMPEGGRITFRTGVHGDEAYCVVTDTGPGMTTEVRQRVFDPFFTTKAEKGTGLGLSVAYGIITRHGGSIEVESEPGQGSAFTIRLPVASEIPAGLAKPPPPRPQHGARVLVIDDEERVRQVLVEMLLGQGHVVTACADARSGLVRFHEEPFDLVFTDLAMPAVSGWEVARLVKQERPGTPVVLVTGWGDQIELGEARAKGADWVVAKPFEIEGVRAAVARALSRPG